MYVYVLAYVLPMSGAYESCIERSLKYIQIKFKNLYIFFIILFLPIHYIQMQVVCSTFKQLVAFFS